jgi:hypothetical protein
MLRALPLRLSLSARSWSRFWYRKRNLIADQVLVFSSEEAAFTVDHQRLFNPAENLRRVLGLYSDDDTTRLNAFAIAAAIAAAAAALISVPSTDSASSGSAQPARRA